MICRHTELPPTDHGCDGGPSSMCRRAALSGGYVGRTKMPWHASYFHMPVYLMPQGSVSALRPNPQVPQMSHVGVHRFKVVQRTGGAEHHKQRTRRPEFRLLRLVPEPSWFGVGLWLHVGLGCTGDTFGQAMRAPLTMGVGDRP